MKHTGIKYFFIAILIISGCSTEKNTLVTRTYHNLTSHYNIFFNGDQSYLRGLKKIEEGYEDDYSRLLPVFYYKDPAVSQTVMSEMDRAIEKATKVISLHSITVKPDLKRGAQTEKQKAFYKQKEYNKWVDENYNLMGKAYMYKNEFRVAIETFRKTIATFPQEETRFEAMIWLARAFIEMEDYIEAERLLTRLKNEDKLPDRYLDELYITFADYYIQQDKFTQAITFLQDALDELNTKHYRIRYTYLLAQLFQETGQSVQAIRNYRKVIRMNPPYEMTFNAKINMAGAFDANTGKGEEIRTLLRKMLKDDKNIEFQDQIYYALGKIALKEEKTDKAIEDFILSAKNSTDNYNQKGLSYIALGDIYYNIPDYALSQAYYDSSLQNIESDYDGYEQLSTKATSLTNLVQHLTVYQNEDSLQRLAALPEKELFAVIDRIIEEVEKKEEEERLKKQEEMLDRQYGMSMGNNNRTSNRNQDGGKWYFYNMNAKSFGQPEFRMKWGNRKLEDNWRRKNKQSIQIINNTEEGEAIDSASSGTTKVLNKMSREYYLSNIPFTDSAMSVSNNNMKEALYNMGLVYRNELLDIDEARISFEKVVERFPNDEFALLSAYNLYEIYNQKGNSSQSNFYKNWIIRNFPDSPRAMILSDPEYVQKLTREQNRVNVFYEETYELFNAGMDERVIQNVEIATREFSEHAIIPKYKLLGAISKGRLQGKDVLSAELGKIIEQYPGTEESKYARELIESLYKKAPDLEIADTREKAEEIYSYDTTGIFYFGVTTSEKQAINQLKFNLINFNLDNFDNLNLGLQSEMIDETNVIFISSFENPEMADRYLSAFLASSESVFKDVDVSDVSVFIVSRGNLQVLKDDKDLRKYMLFYEKHY